MGQFLPRYLAERAAALLPQSCRAARQLRANAGNASGKTVVIGEGDMHHQLAFRRVTGNVPFA
jgi:hypothetical protein